MKFGRTDYDSRIIDTDHRIPDDEPVFFLRGNDPLAPRLLLTWAMELRLAGGDPAMAKSAENHAQRMLEWQRINGVKTPDLVRESEEKLNLKNSINKLLSNSQLDIKSIIRLLSEYTGADGYDYFSILITADLRPESVHKSPESLDLSDFIIPEDGLRKIHKDLLVIYVEKTKFIVLKNAL